VVDEDDDGLFLTELGQELQHRLENVELRCRAQLARVEQSRQRLESRVADAAPAVVCERGAQRAEDLHPRPKAGRAGAVPAHADPRTRTTPASLVEQLERQAGLPDAWLPRDQDEPPDARERLVEDAVQATQWLLAADEGRRAHACILAGSEIAGARSDLAP